MICKCRYKSHESNAKMQIYFFPTKICLTMRTNMACEVVDYKNKKKKITETKHGFMLLKLLIILCKKDITCDLKPQKN